MLQQQQPPPLPLYLQSYILQKYNAQYDKESEDPLKVVHVDDQSGECSFYNLSSVMMVCKHWFQSLRVILSQSNVKSIPLQVIERMVDLYDFDNDNLSDDNESDGVSTTVCYPEWSVISLEHIRSLALVGDLPIDHDLLGEVVRSMKSLECVEVYADIDRLDNGFQQVTDSINAYFHQYNDHGNDIKLVGKLTINDVDESFDEVMAAETCYPFKEVTAIFICGNRQISANCKVATWMRASKVEVMCVLDDDLDGDDQVSLEISLRCTDLFNITGLKEVVLDYAYTTYSDLIIALQSKTLTSLETDIRFKYQDAQDDESVVSKLQEFVDRLHTNTTLTNLSLWSDFSVNDSDGDLQDTIDTVWTDGLAILLQKNQTLKHLMLDYVHFLDERFFESLASNTTLETLTLPYEKWRQLKEKHCKLLYKTLSQNRTLKLLDMDLNSKRDKDLVKQITLIPNRTCLVKVWNKKGTYIKDVQQKFEIYIILCCLCYSTVIIVFSSSSSYIGRVEAQSTSYTLSNLTLNSNNKSSSSITATGYFGDDLSVVSVWIDEYTHACQLTQFTSYSLNCTVKSLVFGNKTVSIKIGDTFLNSTLFFDTIPPSYTLSSLSQNDFKIIALGYFGDNSSSSVVVSVWIDRYTECPIISFNSTSLTCTFEGIPAINVSSNKTVTIFIGYTTALNGSLVFYQVPVVSHVTYNGTANTISIYGNLSNTGGIYDSDVYFNSSVCTITFVSSSLVNCQLNRRFPTDTYTFLFRNGYTILYPTVYILSPPQPQQNYTLSSLSQDNNEIIASGYFGDNSSLVSVWISSNEDTPCHLVSFNSSVLRCTINNTMGNTSGNKTVNIRIGNATVLTGTVYFNNVYSISRVTYNSTLNSIVILGVFNDTAVTYDTSVHITRDNYAWFLCTVTFVSSSLVYCQLNERVPIDTYTVVYRNEFTSIYSTVNITYQPYNLTSLSFDYNQTITATGYFGHNSSLVSVLVEQYTPCKLVSFNSTQLRCTISPRPTGTRTVTIKIGYTPTVLNGTLDFDNGPTNYSIQSVTYNSTLNTIRITGNLRDTNTAVTIQNGTQWIRLNITSLGTGFINCQLNDRLPIGVYDLSLQSPYYILYSTVNITSLPIPDYDIHSLSQNNNEIIARGYFGNDSSLVSVWVEQYTPCKLVSFNSSVIRCTFGGTQGNTSGNKTVSIRISNAVLSGTLYFNKIVYSIHSVTYNSNLNSIRIIGVLVDSENTYYTSVYISRNTSTYQCAITFVSSSHVDCQLPTQLLPTDTYTIVYRNEYNTLYSTVNITYHPYNLTSLSFDGNQTISANGFFGANSSLVSVWVGGNQSTACPLVSFNSTNLKCTVSPRPTGTKTITIKIGYTPTVLNGTLDFGNGPTNYSIHSVTYNSTLNTIRITGNLLDTNTTVAIQNGVHHVGVTVTSFGTGFVNCQLHQRLPVNTTYPVYLTSSHYSLTSSVYITPEIKPNPNLYFSSFTSILHPLGLKATGSFGDNSNNVNITSYYNGRTSNCIITYFSSTYLMCSLGNNYPAIEGFYPVNGGFNGVIYNTTNVYFKQRNSTSSSSSSWSSSSVDPSSSSSSSDVTCTLSRSGKLKVEYPGNAPINCTSQGISECNVPGGFQCLGLLSSSSTRCSAPHEIVCQASSIVCRVGGMSCSIEGGQLSIKADTALPPNDNSQSDSNSQTNDASPLSSVSFSTLFILSLLSIIASILI
ncbi:hypothetical protein DFA_04970 [Cavenderia fasciculata]|uniref:IPT/TIG domain-containing protein n=1 Tax=Cavenderia fasciculata TaxID=261658 RepID=F4PMP3_CACFS|nr:uncharacterized protein DFA_04970 [Cavenderia fasciculata]EGG22840.1 hypothetical protein DFA_04970 [Cavenderia fasciculata]|eukprot:XP_004360691.1 hypothetical protein DFA_04970 [Cavenderia fasciculata]